MEHHCNLSMREVEEGDSEVQDHPWFHIEFKTNLDYMRPWGRGDEGDREEKERDFKFYSGCCEYLRYPQADDKKHKVYLDISCGSPNYEIPQLF